MLRLLKEFVKALKTHFKLSTKLWYCPYCYGLSDNKNYWPTGHAHMLYDKYYKKFKFFVKCKSCHTTTPAFESSVSVVENWEDLYAKFER